jgi:enoyl-CoA hydratase/carnithine racemase
MTSLPQITIAAVEGVARGAGNEFLVSIDMRFATKAHTLLGQPEIGLGLIPGGGGSQYLSRLIGRGRAMEYILSGKDVSASDAERIGWINKAFDTSAEMYAQIDELTSRMTLFPLGALGLAKQSVNRATRPQIEDILQDATDFLETVINPAAQAAISRAMALSRNQSDGDIELFLGERIPLFYN